MDVQYLHGGDGGAISRHLTMYIHIHIPKLLQYALYVVCDDITLRDNRPSRIPYSLYLRCISTFAAKRASINDNHSMHGGVDVIDTLWSYISVIDHAVLTPVAMPSLATDKQFQLIVSIVIGSSDNDVEGVVQCIHRFASRCRKHDVLTRVMTDMLALSPCRAIRDVLVNYGAIIERNSRDFIDNVCKCGSVVLRDLTVMMELHTALETEAHRITLGRRRCEYLESAISSGDIATVVVVTMLTKQVRGAYVYDYMSTELQGRDWTVQLCEVMEQLELLKSHKRVKVKGLCNAPLVKWLYERDMIDVQYVMTDIAQHAAESSDIHYNLLQYLVEQLHIPVPRRVLLDLKDDISDLGVFDYLILHGALVNVYDSAGTNLLCKSPLLTRYWVHNGVVIAGISDEWSSRILYNFLYLPSNILELLIQTLHPNVNVRYDPCADIGYEHARGDVDYEASMQYSSVLHRALHDNRYDNAKLLLKYGANPNGSVSLLHIFCMEHDSRAVEMLVRAGAHVNRHDGDGCTPLHRAVQCRDIGILHVLISNGADVNARDHHGNTPLMMVATDMTSSDDDDDYDDINEAYDLDIELLNTLVFTYGADVDDVNDYGDTVFHRLMRGGHIDIVQCFMSNSNNLSLKNNKGETLLYMAYAERDADLVDEVLDAGGDANVRHSDGRTVLCMACDDGSIDMVNVLIKHGADVNAVNDGDGDTPLHAACRKFNGEIVQLLMNSNARYDIVNTVNETAYDVANNEIQHLLYQYKDKAKDNSC